MKLPPSVATCSAVLLITHSSCKRISTKCSTLWTKNSFSQSLYWTLGPMTLTFSPIEHSSPISIVAKISPSSGKTSMTSCFTSGGPFNMSKRIKAWPGLVTTTPFFPPLTGSQAADVAPLSFVVQPVNITFAPLLIVPFASLFAPVSSSSVHVNTTLTPAIFDVSVRGIFLSNFAKMITDKSFNRPVSGFTVHKCELGSAWAVPAVNAIKPSRSPQSANALRFSVDRMIPLNIGLRFKPHASRVKQRREQGLRQASHGIGWRQAEIDRGFLSMPDGGRADTLGRAPNRKHDG